MRMSELIEYAHSVYDLEEEHRWAHFPGFSVLVHPRTGKRVALLIRHRDNKSGEEVEHCDIRCGLDARKAYANEKYLGVPFRMRGEDWVGVSFWIDTDPGVVYDLLDYAMFLDERKGAPLIVLDAPDTGQGHVYEDTPLPPSAVSRQAAFETAPISAPIQENADDIPERIRKMQSLYSYASFSRDSKDAWNFYHQGKYMEDYEDDQPWDFKAFEYYPVYSDFSVSELRGYFSWRTHVRRGEYPPVSTSLAYMYIYELLCGIGTTSPQDTLDKLKAFENGFLGPPGAEEDDATRRMRRNIKQWSFEYAIIKQLPPSVLVSYADPVMLAKDNALAVLHQPAQHTDDEVFSALCRFTGSKLRSSAFVKSQGAEGRRLFADLWRFLMNSRKTHEKSIFTECFGQRSTRKWNPLATAVYYEDTAPSVDDAKVELNPVRTYNKRPGRAWTETCYWNQGSYVHALRELVHEADRLFRLDRKTGRPLKPDSKAAWATPRVRAFLEAENKAAKKQSVRIDFSELARIRRDAGETRDSLLTDEEREQAQPLPVPEAVSPEKDSAAAIPALEVHAPAPGAQNLDDLHRQILVRLLAGQAADDLIRTNHLMESIVMDSINEALFDEVGDNVLEYNGSTLSIVEDYREDITQALGGVTV